MVDSIKVGVSEDDVLEVAIFYAYALNGAPMLAIRAPFAAPADGAGLVGRLIATPTGARKIVLVARRASGPIARGEPIGVEIHAVEAKPVGA